MAKRDKESNGYVRIKLEVRPTQQAKASEMEARREFAEISTLLGQIESRNDVKFTLKLDGEGVRYLKPIHGFTRREDPAGELIKIFRSAFMNLKIEGRRDNVEAALTEFERLRPKDKEIFTKPAPKPSVSAQVFSTSSPIVPFGRSNSPF